MTMPAGITGKRLGILGMGHIGRKVALRALAFEMEVAYCSRSGKPEVPYARFDRVAALAAWRDVLVVATPGGPQTRHQVDGEVLKAIIQLFM